MGDRLARGVLSDGGATASETSRWAAARGRRSEERGPPATPFPSWTANTGVRSSTSPLDPDGPPKRLLAKRHAFLYKSPAPPAQPRADRITTVVTFESVYNLREVRARSRPLLSERGTLGRRSLVTARPLDALVKLTTAEIPAAPPARLRAPAEA